MLSLLFWAILGLAIGSFIAAFTYRLPSGISIATGRSFCPKCKKKISWFDNIPIGSYFVLKGRCRHCGKRISPRYPLIETAAAIGFIAFAGQFFLLFVFTLALAILVIDWEKQIVPDSLVFLGFLATLVYFLLVNFNFYESLLAGLAAALFLLLVHLVTTGRGMGLGDVKLALFLGTIIGLSQVFHWLVLSFVLGAVIGLVLVFIGRARFGRPIPFGPFLIIAFFVILKWAEYV